MLDGGWARWLGVVKMDPVSGAYHVQWQSDRWFWSRQNPDRRYKQVKPHIQPLEKHVLYGLIML